MMISNDDETGPSHGQPSNGAVKKKSPCDVAPKPKRNSAKVKNRKKKAGSGLQDDQFREGVEVKCGSPKAAVHHQVPRGKKKSPAKELELTEDAWPTLDAAVAAKSGGKRRSSEPRVQHFSEVPEYRLERTKASPRPRTRAPHSPANTADGKSHRTPKKGTKSPQRNFRFEPYIPLFEVQQGLKRGEFIEGALRINPRNYEDAYVSAPDGSMDIYIGGTRDRNRALNGDTVVVQVNPKQEWRVLCDAIKDYQDRHGATVVEAVYSPDSTPCKIHTPEKFSRAQSRASSAWSQTRGERYPDTLEILGVDALAEELSNLSMKPRKKNRSKRHRLKSRSTPSSEEGVLEPGSQKSSTSATTTTTFSHGSSEDYLSRVSSETSPDHNAGGRIPTESDAVIDEVAGRTGRSENGATAFDAHADSNGVPESNIHLDKPVDHEVGNSSSVKGKSDCTDSWDAECNAVKIVISPEVLLDVEDGNALELNGISKSMDAGDVNGNASDDSSSSNEHAGVVVPPDDLSGDEYTESASTSSSPTREMEQTLEDAEFLASQHDVQNNNAEVIDEHPRLGNLSSVGTELVFPLVSSVTSTTAAGKIFAEQLCGVEHIAKSSAQSMECVVSESVCSTVGLLSTTRRLENCPSADEQAVCYEPSVPGAKIFVPQNLPLREQMAGSKKSKRRKRTKSKRADKDGVDLSPSEDFLLSADVESLTVDEVMKHPLWQEFIQKTGRVVSVLERKHSCVAAGHLKLLQDRNPHWALFSPKDSRIPRMMVPMVDCPNQFYYRPDDYSGFLFLAEITDWREDAKYPLGRLLRNLGDSGEIEPETEGILLENSVDYGEFPDEVIDCLPKKGWSVPEKEVRQRKDFRNICIFTIDPATARDMDDAVSCEFLPNGNFLVGVHIADVTYFVREGTALDECARSRATSVYLVQKVIPMLPRMLCDNLCSLTPGEDRLTFSVLWEMTAEGNTVNEYFERSIIRSCMKMSYEHAQEMIDKPSKEWSSSEHPEIFGNFDISDISLRVCCLNQLAIQLRKRRFEEGALRLDQTKLQFTLNPETGLPLGFSVYEQKDSNRLIEEFMLLANMAVAHRIYERYPQLSLLRRHPPPQMKPLKDVIKACARVGIHLDASSSGALQASISRYAGPDELSRARTLVLTHLCSKPMNCALYFCSGVVRDPAMFHHYALNVPLYTHFTSPIRRYPDIIVHRLLGATLNQNPLPRMKPEVLHKCADHCNTKKYNAKRVSEMSDELFFSVFVRHCKRIDAKAMVIGVMDHSFDCLILHFGVVKRAYCDKLPLRKKEFKKVQGIPSLTLFWHDKEHQSELLQTITMFSLVDVSLSTLDTLQVSVTLKMPSMSSDNKSLY